MSINIKPKYRKGSLESRLSELLTPISGDQSYTVIFHELWREAEGGWSVNDSWIHSRNVDLESVLVALRGRWEIFKLNYFPKAAIKDIQDAAWEGTETLLEVDCTSFATIRVNE